MIPGALDDITSQDLQRVVDQGLGEGRQLEFKGFHDRLPARDRVLNTVCAFANTDGGDLVLGVSAPDGFAESFAPVPRDQMDTEKLRVLAWVNTGIEPTVAACHVQEVEADGGFALVVRVGRSWAGPHRVAHTRRFMGRNSGGNYELPMDQVRQAFTEGSLLVERIRDFRAERVELLKRGLSPVRPFKAGPKVMLHLVPPGGIVRGDQIDVQLAYQQIIREADIGLGYDLGIREFNFDGVLGSNVTDKGLGLAYVQVFRNGTLEAVRELPAKPEVLKPNAGGEVAPVDRFIAPYLEQLLGFLGKLSVEPPLIVLVTAIGVARRQLWIEDPYTGHRFQKLILDRDTLLLPEVELPSFEPSPERKLRPAFDVFWNAFGHSKSQLFNAEGDYTGPG